MEEQKKKDDPIDGRRFNRRSRARTEREAREIKKSIMKASRKKASRKNMYRGVFSQEEIDAGIEEKKEFKRMSTEAREAKNAAQITHSEDENVPSDTNSEPMEPIES